jgi:fucose 4-O-acetylase-like acetyltransferase
MQSGDAVGAPEAQTQSDQSATKRRRRLIAVDMVTAIVITLVVVGHVASSGSLPDDNAWYSWMKYRIYQFHMPAFMFVSGVVFFYTMSRIDSLKAYGEWSAKKIKRFAVPFIAFGAVVIIGKMVVSAYLHVDNNQGSLWDKISSLIIAPIAGPSASLWYIYVLLEFVLLFPILLAITRNSTVAILVITTAMHVIWMCTTITDTLMLSAVFEYAFFFSLGMPVIKYYDPLCRVSKRYVVLWWALFIGLFALIGYVPETVTRTLLGLAAIPALFGLVQFAHGRTAQVLIFVGGYSFTIYLMNTITIGVTKGVLMRAVSWDGPNFYWYFPLLLLVGVAGPIAIHRYGLARVPSVAKMTK